MYYIKFYRSFDYVEKELVKIPAHIPVLVLGNHCDMAHHRTVTADHVTFFIESVQRYIKVSYLDILLKIFYNLNFLIYVRSYKMLI